MSAEEIFQRENSAFQFAFQALFVVLDDVFGSVGSCFNGTFNVGMREV
jgi:hypothetical protein